MQAKTANICVFDIVELAQHVVSCLVGSKQRWTPQCALLRCVSKLLYRLVGDAVLRYECAQLDCASATAITSWPSLQKLTIRAHCLNTPPFCTRAHCMVDAWLHLLSHLTTLSFKCLHRVHYQTLARLTQLRSLRLWEVPNGGGAAIQMLQMTWLTELKVYHFGHGANAHLVNQFLPHLRSLVIYEGGSTGGINPQNLVLATNLRKLRLSSWRLTDDVLLGLTKLTSLGLSGSARIHLTALTRLSLLAHLDLRSRIPRRNDTINVLPGDTIDVLRQLTALTSLKFDESTPPTLRDELTSLRKEGLTIIDRSCHHSCYDARYQ